MSPCLKKPFPLSESGQHAFKRSARPDMESSKLRSKLRKSEETFAQGREMHVWVVES